MPKVKGRNLNFKKSSQIQKITNSCSGVTDLCLSYPCPKYFCYSRDKFFTAKILPLVRIFCASCIKKKTFYSLTVRRKVPFFLYLLSVSYSRCFAHKSLLIVLYCFFMPNFRSNNLFTNILSFVVFLRKLFVVSLSYLYWTSQAVSKQTVLLKMFLIHAVCSFKRCCSVFLIVIVCVPLSIQSIFILWVHLQ